MNHVGYAINFNGRIGTVWESREKAMAGRDEYRGLLDEYPIVRVFIEPDPEADIPELEAVEGLFAGIDRHVGPGVESREVLEALRILAAMKEQHHD